MTERGTVLGGRYELDQVIGRGGMAEVWRARDTRLQRDVAVKRLRLDLASDSTFQARFRREAQASAGLNHPNIVAVYDTGEQADPNSGVQVPYIVMELIEGVTLREVLRGGRKIVPEKALEFTAGVLDALAYSHRAGIIHRDIKPANVMFTPPGTVKVMDFGIARAVADTSATMTQTAAVIGTAQYLSPEQARGQKVDNRSDIYAVGVLLYELLTSEPPFKGDSPVSVVFQHVREAPVPPSQRDPEITRDMDAIVMRALEKDPRDRYQDASEMREDILRVLNHQPIKTPPPVFNDQPTQVIASDPITTTARRAAPVAAGVGAGNEADVEEPDEDEVEETDDEERRRKWPIIVIAVLAALLLIGVIVLLFMLNAEPAEDPSPTPTPTVTRTEEEPSPTPTVERVAVPHLDGMGRQEAENRLKDVGLSPVIESVTDGATEDNADTIEHTDPAGGTEVTKGSEVTLYVYKYDAPTTVTMPDLVGMTEQEARDELQAVGFEGKVETRKADPANEPIDAVAGQVLSADPSGQVRVDGTVTLTLATGESTVPGLTGMNEQRARDVAGDRGFQIEVEEVETADHDEGIVFDQDPKEGSTKSRQEPVRVKIAVAPVTQPTETPSDDGDNGQGEPGQPNSNSDGNQGNGNG
ncbi:Stk1 family PASTA domain-containing Ser/Thr kinase [uncultured Tessaracoccus sp.]|uniref:Stk1 family PASTA domain-containing Ser/Thr kinase n=1 Tax=uncultured Tessaracoccus sp. TaxID=905023 RepID=UPI0025E48A3E|nr:Stk1 family PASTA domain-containing Ser/Thr kinase [uncultured Tessaracoccus sp.]